jgi:hypothetical protein
MLEIEEEEEKKKNSFYHKILAINHNQTGESRGCRMYLQN